jgi:hypothetical protein
LTAECIARGFNITDFSDSFEGITPSLWKNYTETTQDRKVVVQRVNERLLGMKNLKYNRVPVEAQQILIQE